MSKILRGQKVRNSQTIFLELLRLEVLYNGVNGTYFIRSVCNKVVSHDRSVSHVSETDCKLGVFKV